jgi:hypothetical protein
MRETAIAAARRAGTHAMSTPLPLRAGGEGPPPTTRAVGCVRARRRWARVRRAGRSRPGLLSLSLSLSPSLSVSLSCTHSPPAHGRLSPHGEEVDSRHGPRWTGRTLRGTLRDRRGRALYFFNKKQTKNITKLPPPRTLLFSPPAPNPAPRGRGGRLPHPWRLSPPAAPPRPPARAALAWPPTPAEKGRPGRWARAF